MAFVRDDGPVSYALTLVPALDRPDLLADPVRDAIAALGTDNPTLRGAFQVAEIDPELADTAAFCERYQVPMSESANCVLVAGKRAGETRMAAALVLATSRADVNGALRRLLDVRKASFASRDVATEESGMEYGGITPVGLPKDWPVYLDGAVAAAPRVVIGSGVRRSKLVVAGSMLAALPTATVVDDLATPA
ncbi:MAG TPA: YbaK/EbsC family protein [Pseudonocardia sp.]|jgi:prolyl-tRNA editing enzyme YbaK/EbsC (Cys-tRNA(Pro) deacylase)|uniref:YbaK/EbsC family protein n=1 Tax=Pseudonocardia sp. TaxID=60912 RepID=UPI002F40FA50